MMTFYFPVLAIVLSKSFSALSQDGEGRIINSQTNTRRCIGPDKSFGYCTHAARCPLPEFKVDRLRFMDYFCIIDRQFIGVCCPDSFLFQTQAGSTVIGNPGVLFPSKDGGGSTGLNPVPEPPTPKPSEGVTPAAVPQRSGCGLNEKQDVGRVTGGRPADPKEWPWMAALMDRPAIQFCGGCLITDKHVLTAAHCVYKLKRPSDIYVRLGEHDFQRIDETRPQDVNISSIRNHKEFDEVTYENDISILTLGRSVTFNSYVWPACLPQPGKLYTDQTAFVIGWGTLEYGGPQSEQLMEVSVPVWENDACSDFYVQPIRGTNLCAGGQGGKDSCQGDSGGPLLLQLENRRWITIGVVSWGIKCGESRPAVYTRVTSYIDWIVANTF